MENINKEQENTGENSAKREDESINYIPITRFNEVIAQKNAFKTQITMLNERIDQMKQKLDDGKHIESKLDKIAYENKALLESLENTKLERAVLLAAREAYNPEDVVKFIDKSKITTDNQGNLVGLDKEIERLKAEKSYLFQISPNRAGTESTRDILDAKVTMNDLIRRRLNKTN